VQAEVADRLFRAYFVEGRDIGDRGVLTAIAGECGLDASEVEKRLADDADIDLVRQEIEQAQAMGVSGVPFFIFGGRIGVPGAQEPSVLRQAIAQARQEMAEGAGTWVASA
jgi:predicted DsbA family dithiol-disulfide isomerase